MATLNPARILRLEDRKGSIAPGKDADLVLWDEDFNVLMTIVAGETVFTGADFRLAMFSSLGRRKMMELG